MIVVFSRSSQKCLARCGDRTRRAIVEAIEALPDHGDVRKLKGQAIKNAYRLRIGRYRIIYVWEKDEIKILDIDTRGDIYK